MRKIIKIIRKIILNDIFSTVIRLTLVAALIVSLIQQAWFNSFICVLAIILSYSHIVFAKYNIHLPKEFQVFIILFIYSSLFLGEIQNYYHKFWWWDNLLHGLSGLSLGFAGFLIMYIFYKTQKFKGPVIIISIFSFCFALSLGAIWEIFEYSCDQILGTNTQKARNLELIYGYFDTRLGVQDTMKDLIIDSAGALITSLIGYIYLIKGESFSRFDHLVISFEKLNKKLFDHK